MNQFYLVKACLLLMTSLSLALGAMSRCQAELVLLGFGDVRWDRVADPLESPSIVVGITGNASGGSINELEAFNIGLRFVPIDAAIGTLEVAGVSEPRENAAFPFDQTPLVTYINDLSLFDASHDVNANVTITLPRALFEMTLASPEGNALGRYEVHAVPEFTQYFTTTAFDGFSFANADGSHGYFLGTVEVTAIPEPGAVAGLTAMFAAWLCLRRERSLRRDRSWSLS